MTQIVCAEPEVEYKGIAKLHAMSAAQRILCAYGGGLMVHSVATPGV